MFVKRTLESLSVSPTRHPPSPAMGRSRPGSYVVAGLLTRDTGQVGKVLGERWKALNEKQRAPYESKAKADKERYETEKASYNVSVSIPFPSIVPWSGDTS